MWVPEGFDSWADYRTFVERTQRSLYDQLRVHSEGPALGIEEGTTRWTLFEDEAVLGVGWWEPFRAKWMYRHIHYNDTVAHLLWQDDSDGMSDRELVDEQRQQILVGDLLSDDSEGRETAYDAQAPLGALLAEGFLDAVTCYLAGLTVVGGERRGTAYDAAHIPETHGNTTAALVTEWLFEPFDRTAVVDGHALADARETLGRRYDQLAPLTVWGTTPGPKLAIPDDDLPDGRGQSRRWQVTPSPALSGFEPALVTPETARATVTLTGATTHETPTGHRISGYHDATVDECDDEFPAQPGDNVLVTTANVVDYASDEPVKPGDGVTKTQRTVINTAQTAPADVDEDDVASLLTWVTTGTPTARADSATALGAVATASSRRDTIVETLADVLSDDVVEVRQCAGAALCSVASAGPASLRDHVGVLVDALDDGDETVCESVAATLLELAEAMPSLFRGHLRCLRTQLARRVDIYLDGSKTVRVALVQALEHLQAAGYDVLGDGDTVVIAAALGPSDQRLPALRILVATQDERFETLVSAVQRQLCDPLRSDQPERRIRAVAGLQRLAAVETELVLAAGVCETLLAVGRGDYRSNPDERGIPEAGELLAVLAVADPDRVTPASVVSALTQEVNAPIRQTHADALGYLGSHYPVRVTDAVGPLLGTACGDPAGCEEIHQTQALAALSKIAHVAPGEFEPSVRQRVRDLVSTTDSQYVRSRAEELLALVGDPVVTDGVVERVATDWQSLLPPGQRAVVGALAAIAESDRDSFTDAGGFAWLCAIHNDAEDPRVRTDTVCALVEQWINDPEFVEQRCLPLDTGSVESTDEGRFVADRTGLLGLAVDAEAPVPDARGITVVAHLLATAGSQRVAPIQRRVGRILEGLATGKQRRNAVVAERVKPVVESAVDMSTESDERVADWERQLVALLERVAVAHPDRTATVVGDLGTALLIAQDQRMSRVLIPGLVRAGEAAETVAAALVDALGEADGGLAASVVLLALREHASDATVERARTRVQTACTNGTLPDTLLVATALSTTVEDCLDD